MEISDAMHQSDDLVANLRFGGSSVRELASGVDALYLSGRGILGPDLLVRLQDLRGFADEFKAWIPFNLGGKRFELAPHGWGKYRYCLANEMGRIGITTSNQLPTVRIQPKAELLHAVGPHAAVCIFEDLVSAEILELRLLVSRVDLFVDLKGWDLVVADADRFVARASSRRTYEEDEHFTGFEFGSRKTGGLTARIYDKTIDVELKGSDWWHDIWGEAHEQGARVLRVEFEFGRQILKEFQLSEPGDVLAATGDLWRYATEDWLSFRSPTSDQTRSRWPVAEEWQVVERAPLRSRAIGVARVRHAAAAGTLRQIIPGLNGYLVSFASAVGTTDVHEALRRLEPHLEAYERSSETPFADRVARRQIGRGT